MQLGRTSRVKRRWDSKAASNFPHVIISVIIVGVIAGVVIIGLGRARCRWISLKKRGRRL
jgi:hypothetical protein